MLNIIIPNNNIPEREYIIRILFFDYLGLHYNVIVNDANLHYAVCFEKSELVIQDSFFGLYPDNLSYLTTEAFPKKIVYAKNDFTAEKDIPVIYGTDELLVAENVIICGIDIFASSFFMLTRWEEYVNKTRDEHSRFPGNESIAFRNGFLQRPVVNEYVEILWGLLQKLDYKGQRKKRTFELVLTHDVDHLDYPKTYRIILGDILKRRNLKLALEHFKHYWLTGSNPYDTFDYLMTISEKLGVKSHFYFMSSDSKLFRDPSLYLRSKRFKSKIEEIKKRGHIIGFHPGYYTFDNLERWTAEKLLLEKAVHSNIKEGRQHYLRFDIIKTFRLWDKNNMGIDSTLGYSDCEGFRCGTGDIFTVFDFLEKKQIRVKERPLIIMDGTMRQYRKYSQEQALKIIQNYISIGKRYNSPITLLFHNSSFYGEWEEYRSLYDELLNLSI
jgi:hypothetical protein